VGTQTSEEKSESSKEIVIDKKRRYIRQRLYPEQETDLQEGCDRLGWGPLFSIGIKVKVASKRDAEETF
jgi:hypothetical protein